jgi:hypothetical protein
MISRFQVGNPEATPISLKRYQFQFRCTHFAEATPISTDVPTDAGRLRSLLEWGWTVKNYWGCLGDPVAKWDADLSALWSRPEAMLEWVRQVTVVGEQLQVMRVLESPTLRYRRDRDGSPLPLLEELFHRSRAVDLFYFTCASVPVNGVFPRSRVSGRMAYFDERGNVQEEDVEQLGQLLLRCRPDVIQTVTANVRPTFPVGCSRLAARGTRGLTLSRAADDAGKMRPAKGSDPFFNGLLA